ESFIAHTKSIMTMLNARDISELKQSKLVFDQKLMSWIDQRGLDIHRG
ncbi:type 2 isopentenyl-diphosphate Delta-isomerase, partial [Staphylococcus aureus]|nr:type 2 isopentenyl-diphosphate Delta-isomerase [Staphylococcus aureus]